MHPSDLLHEHLVLPGAGRGPGWIGTLRDMGVLASGAIGRILQIGSTP